jgi:hypothetical protein
MEETDAAALTAARRAWGSWDAVATALDQELLAPLMGWRLRAQHFPGDARFKERLAAAARETLAANLKARRTFERVRAELAAAGITALGIKGVDVAFASFPHPACRPFTDVDLLVSPDNYRAAEAVLTGAGFRGLKREARWWPGRTFRRADETVDLHWSPAAALPPRRGMAAMVYEGGDGGATPDEFRLLVAVCHHQNHFFSLPLLYYWETAWLARRVAWEKYWPLARRWSAARATRFLLAFAAAMFGGAPARDGFGLLKLVAAPAFGGADLGRGARAAAAYAVSLDNPLAALLWGVRRPGWASEILTRPAGDRA